MSPPVLHALTLWQPWAWAIAHGPKRIENRTWVPPAWILGKRIAIHAGLRDDAPARAWLEEHRLGLGLTAPVPPHDLIARGAVVALATVGGFLRPGARGADDPWFRGPAGWRLEDVVAIAPVPCLGHQKLWALPPEAARRVRSAESKARRAAREGEK